MPDRDTREGATKEPCPWCECPGEQFDGHVCEDYGRGAVTATLVPTNTIPDEVPPDPERREWPSMDAWFADPKHYWFPEPEPVR